MGIMLADLRRPYYTEYYRTSDKSWSLLVFVGSDEGKGDGIGAGRRNGTHKKIRYDIYTLLHF